MKPDATYITRLLMILQNQLVGAHRKITELENLRYMEDNIQLSKDERLSGIEVRIGMSADLIESVKSSIVSNPPMVHFRPLEADEDAQASATKRAQFWQAFLEQKVNRPTQLLTKFVDSLVGTGYGIFKSQVCDYPVAPRKRRSGESDRSYLDRVKNLKRLYGPPLDAITVHPLAFYQRLGKNDEVIEVIEHSYKAKADVYRTFSINDDEALRTQQLDKRMLAPGVELDPNLVKSISSTQGQPSTWVKSLPVGTDTTTMVLVTEYWSPDWYQVWINRRLVFEEENPSLKYFMALGQITSSTDPDKLGHSTAEILRHNEPTVNRMLTRVAESVELLVKKRLTIQMPEGDTSSTLTLDEPTGEVVAKEYKFTPDFAETLPAGAKVVDPYEGVYHAFEAMPFVSLMMQVLSQHGVAPIFKGNSPGAQGSGYRDNSLYMMAQNKYQYLVDAYQAFLTEFIMWCERMVTERIQEVVYLGNYEISPADIDKYPCEISVVVEPSLPQRTIAEGEFYMQAADRRYVSKRIAQTEGLKLNNPDEVDREILLDDIKAALRPTLVMDVISSVGGVPSQIAGAGAGQDNGAGIQSMNPGANGTQDTVGSAANAVRKATGEQMGGFTTGGQPRTPPESQTPGQTSAPVGAT